MTGDSDTGNGQHPDAWGAVFGADDPMTPKDTKPVAGHASRNVMLKAEPKDTVKIEDVHTGCSKIPLLFTVAQRINTYHGPEISLQAKGDLEAQEHGWILTCPDHKSHLVLWKAVTDPEGYIMSRVRYSTVSATIEDQASYERCQDCGELIKDPMHRAVAMTRTCNGGFNDAR